MASFEEYTYEKLKKDKKKKLSFQEYTESLLKEKEEEDDIAPISELYGNQGGSRRFDDGTVIRSLEDNAGNILVSDRVKFEPEEKKLDFFQKGAFSDGYQFGDITRSILGTAGDASVGVVKGGAGLVEGVKDLGQYGVAGVAGLFGADEYAEKMKKKAQKNSVQDAFKGVDDYLDQYSVLGDTSDSITQGLGQVGTILLTGGLGSVAGWGAKGATALTTGLMGTSSMGSGMSDAYNDGATDGEAFAYGLSKGVIDAGTELLFGGLGKAVGAVGLSKGISSLDDVFAQKLSSGISNQVAKNLVEFGVKASGEGFEEVLAGLGTSVAKKLTYMDEEELKDIIADENLLEQFVVGTVTSGMIQSGYIPATANGSLKEANAKGTDFITGYTQNEQTVVDKLVEEQVKEKQTDGKKLTKKEIGEIEKEVKNSLERGEIEIDKIESVLGGDTYTAYDTLLKESQEYEELYNTKNSDLSKKQEDRLAELTEKNKNTPFKTELSNLREKLSQEVRTKTENDTFLLESYAEKGRRSKTFEADLNKYDEKQQEIVKKAIDSGILNDTKKTHDFVDMLAKLSAEKGVSFDFMNNEKLKESGFAIEGKTINGFVKGKNDIALNINSNKALNTVVGHEITHVLEGTELYTELQTAITEYAKSKGDYDSRFEAISKMYEGVENVNVENELTADLVGDYLFTDSDFINSLSTTKPNVFKKIYNEIKYLLKLATAGSKEAQQLEKVKKAFDKAFKESGNPTADTKYSISDKNISDVSTGYGYGETYFTMSYMQDGKEVAKLDYGVYEDTPNVKMIEVDPEYRRKGIGTKLLQELQKKYPNAEINFGMTTTDGTKLLENATYDVTDEAVVADRQKLKELQIELNELQEQLDVLYEIENISEEQLAELHKLGDRWTEVYDTIRELEQSLRGKKATKTFVKTDNTTPTKDADIRLSLGEQTAPTGKYNVYGKDIALETVSEMENVAPLAQTEEVQEIVQETDEYAPMLEADAVEVLYSLEEEQQEKVAEIDNVVNEEEATENTPLPNGKKDYDARMTNYKNALEGYQTAKDTIVTAYDETINKKTAEYDALKRKDTKKASNLLSQIETLKLRKSENVTNLNSKIARVENIIDNMVNNETKIRDNEKWERKKQRINNNFEQSKQQLREEYDKKQAEAMEELKDRNSFVSKKAYDLYNELKNLKKGVRASEELSYLLDFGFKWGEIKTALLHTKAFPDLHYNEDSAVESLVREAIGRDYEARLEDTSYKIEEEYQNELKELEGERDLELGALEESRTKVKRTDYHRSIVDKIKNAFSSKGYDFDKVLETAKDKGTFSSVDNTPQRFIEKSLGYKEGQILNDLTINKVAQNETEGIKWLNSFTDKKSGLLAKISKEYGIKPRSKESASAQMYAEGFWVDDNGNFIKYGDAELAKDYPDPKVQENIKKLAKDERIRKIYDETLEMINDSRKRNLYPEIPRRNNYFLHFREMEDTFSKLGIPFNPNDIKLKDLPTDINGMTADLKPGQPYFASAKQRLGYKTTYDLVGGVERYLNSAKNQIYHIDDIQTLRALRNYIADTFGQAKGLESLDSMTEEEAMARIEEVYNSHLSTFAKFLNEEANVLAGKTSLTDRGLEGVIGRRGIQFLDTVNRQVGSNMVGGNISSALTNTVSMVQAFAKANKFDATKAFAQTVSNKLGSIVGKTDGFAENSPMMIRRKGVERLTKTPWERVTDAGYLFMSAVDNVSSEFIVRAKFNELTRKGMSEQQAHIEADKWASRILGDRSLGQQPQLYNSKMLGLFTKFQLEVRNQLDSQFYDTIQEAKVSNEEIESRLVRNAKTSAKVASTFFQLAVLQHLFGKAFESVAGYNPAFDIVEALIQVFGLDDDDESEDTVLDNLEEGFLTLLGDLPYTSTLTGGRIPISSALPLEQFITGKDDYGNEKSRWETITETAPYYLLPTGYGQIKKTKQGLAMFDDELPIAGSYTDSGNLRFSVEDTPANRLKSAIFGQYSSETARDYFDNERLPLKEKQIAELVDLDIPIKDYWEYREGLKEQETLDEKFDYIAGLDLPVEKKNIMINNIVDRKEEVDLENYDDFADYDEFDFSVKNPEKYEYLKSINVSYDEYSSSEKTKEAYDWLYQNPDKYNVVKAVTGDVVAYREYAKAINKIEGEKDENGNTIRGSEKANVESYIFNELDLDYGQKALLFKSKYPKDDTYNYDIIDYLDANNDISYEEMVEILKWLGFMVEGNNIDW